MRILHVNKFLYRRGGAEGYLLDLAAMQRRAGHEVQLFGMDHPDNPPLPYQPDFPSHVEFEPPPGGLGGRVQVLGRMLWSTSAARGITDVLDDFVPDVVHFHNIYHQLSPSILRAADRAGVPIVMTLHDYKLACPTYQFLDRGAVCTACVTGGPLQAARRRCKDGSLLPSAIAATEVYLHRRFGAYAPVDVFVCPSRFLRDQMRSAGVFPDRMVHVDNFTETEVPVRSGPGRGVVFGGRLSDEKGVDVLLRAVGRLGGDPALAGVRPLLEIAGDGPERAALERLAADVAPGLVRFHGRLPAERLRELLRGGSVSAAPSRWLENQPLAVLEAFASGVPVVASDIGGLSSMVTPGVDGELVPANDPAALAAALRPYLLDPDLAAQAGRRARHTAVTRHAPEAHLDAIHGIYARAAAHRGTDLGVAV